MKQQKVWKTTLTFALALLGYGISHAEQPSHSIRTSILDNPYVVLAEDPKDNTLSGYVSAIRTAPGRTDECKFFFRGEPFKNGTSHLSITDVVRYRAPSLATGGDVVQGTVRTVGKKYIIEILDADRIGNCDWILGFVGEPSVLQKGDHFEIPFVGAESGEWNRLAIICSKKAYFFHEPSEQKKRKAFVVAGDLLYVFDQTLDWYYVKYSNGRSETVGWIKRSDTLQLQRGKVVSTCN